MANGTASRVLQFFTVFLLSILAFSCFAAGAPPDSDPLASEITRWKNYVANNHDTDEDWAGIRQTVEPLLQKADEAIANGQRYYALHILGSVRYMLAARRYLDSVPADSRTQLTVLDSEWKKAGKTINPVLEGKGLPTLEGQPAAVRAVAEVSLGEIRPYYEASLEYGRNTVADAGLFYIGSAFAQLEFARFCATLNVQHPARQPAAPGLAQEMDAFENELLTLYKPPASVDSHPLFIRTSGLLKEARELMTAGRTDGALYRYLSARLRLTGITGAGSPMTSAEAISRAALVEKQFEEDPGDHSIARIFLEMGVSEAADAGKDSKGGETARAVFDVVLPHYFAALQPAKPQPPKPAPAVTVTLVRWPYT